MGNLIIWTVAVSIIALGGCAAPMKLPENSNRIATAEAARLRADARLAHREKWQRIRRIHHALSLANGDLCGDQVAALSGASFDLNSAYPKSLQAAPSVAQEAEQAITVSDVIPGSAVDRAGVRPGDKILAVNSFTAGEKPRAWLTSVVMPALRAEAPVHLKIENSAGSKVISVTPDLACDYPIRLQYSDLINAYTRSGTIYINTGILRFSRNDDEIAMIIAHEMAHIQLYPRYRGQIVEYNADYISGYLLSRAGYNLAKALDFWRRLAIENPEAIDLQRSGPHPSIAVRIYLLRHLDREIKNQRQKGLQLIPNSPVDRDPFTGVD